MYAGTKVKGAWGYGGEPPPNLENFAVSEGKNGSKMTFCRAIYWKKDIGELLILKNTLTASDTPKNLVKLHP